MFGVQVAAMAEISDLMQANGVSAAKAVEIIGATPVSSPEAKGASASMLSGAFAPMFPLEFVVKEFGYIVTVGRASGATHRWHVRLAS